MPPLRFRWGQDPAVRRPLFECDLECEQCIGATRAGARCRRKTCLYLPYCAQHLKSELSLEVRPSAYGLGLFAARDPRNPGRVVFRPGDWIASLEGERMTKVELDGRYGPDEDNEIAPYAATAEHGFVHDGACRRAVGQYANTRVQALRPHLLHYGACNAEFHLRYTDMNGVNRHPRQFSWIRATKVIREGDEIVAFYGGRRRTPSGRDVPDTATYLMGRTFADMQPHETRR